MCKFGMSSGDSTTWMESGLLAMTERLQSDQSIYAEPSTSYIPLIYPPLHFVVAAWVAATFSSLEGFVGMRMVSLASTVGTAILLAVQMRRSGLGLRRAVAVRGCRGLTKRDMVHNSALPRIEVDAETYQVRADGALLSCEPARVLPMAQRYFLF